MSELAEAGGEDAERMTLVRDGGEEVVFVKKALLLSVKDVEEAYPEYDGRGQIILHLSDEAGKRMRATTSRMVRQGSGRLAIIVEGKLLSAPHVAEPFGKSVSISGLRDLDLGQLDDLARKISGRPPRPEGEAPAIPKPAPKFETVPFTEEEYQQNKAERERAGIYFVEVVPTKEELDETLRKGMSYDEVIRLFGHPSMRLGRAEETDFSVNYQIAPEKIPEHPKREMLATGFQVWFSDGKVANWSHSYSNAQREEKIVGREPALLRATVPEIDFSADDVDVIGYVEGIVIPDIKQEVNKRDLGDLMVIAMTLSNFFDGEPEEKPTLDANCDFMKILSHHFPEVAELRAKAKEGRVGIGLLEQVLSDYAFGEKPFPPLKRAAQPGSAKASGAGSEPGAE